jgi:hypothetical protein
VSPPLAPLLSVSAFAAAGWVATKPQSPALRTTAVVVGLFLLLLRQIRQFSLKPQEETESHGGGDLPQWLCDARCVSGLQWAFHSVRLQLRPYYRQGSLTHDALSAAEGFRSDVESKWAMDPTIVALVVTQLFVATAIGYATAVEVTSDGFVTFILCAVRTHARTHACMCLRVCRSAPPSLPPSLPPYARRFSIASSRSLTDATHLSASAKLTVTPLARLVAGLVWSGLICNVMHPHSLCRRSAHL